MKFKLLEHEKESLSFFRELIKETEDVELKKVILGHYSKYLSDLHEMEKDYRAKLIELEQQYDKNDFEYAKEKLGSRDVRPDSSRDKT